ncbi:EF-hand domain-containing family member B [Drosophila sulfurigaster albostrigata]|uniref:EF-hand domain-containing family member B n=1 Tax=Drosophila sulfurigaster albostrigata TaxID=89887 RepID=UPI002D21D91A|nr:EF-hand domain-containing family member B [Drosophila sulfurigaster albostrigata]
MANVGRFKDRNADMRAAGVSSAVDTENTTGNCLIVMHPEEVAEQLIRAECKRLKLKNGGQLFPETPCLPTVSVPELLAIEKSKSRFTVFKEKFSEDMYLRQAKLAEAKPTGSKPDSVTNWSRTFGRETTAKERLYDLVLPPKKPEQVNQEYGQFHDKYIVSHNHYFPAEQINRKYKQPFDRQDTFGEATRGDTSGQSAKRCMQQCSGHVIIISKEQMDFIDRTYSRLGKKFKKYPAPVPQYITYGTPTHVPDCDCKMLVEDIAPCKSDKHLVDALGHLNMWRHKLQKRADFHMFDLISVLEHSDKTQTRELPAQKIFEVMHKMHLYIDIHKMRVILSLFHMLIDEGCTTERVNYDDFCRLLNIQHPLPTMGNIFTMPPNVYNKDTTYRLLCSDLSKEPIKAAPMRPRRPKQLDDDGTHVKDLLSPDISTLYGLAPSDFQFLRPRDQLQLIFKDIVNTEDFESIWQQLTQAHNEQHGQFSVQQFRDVMDNLEPATQAQAANA